LSRSQGGLLPVVGTVNVDDKEVDTVTFAQLRPRIELKNDNNMIRWTDRCNNPWLPVWSII